jgi:zinc/manganese transport system substrate-binding protein
MPTKTKELKMKIYAAVFFAIFLIRPDAYGKLKVVTTTTDLASITREVGGDEVQVDAIAKGTQDPHYIEAKPSYMTRIHGADLVISIGLGLEVGWLPSILRGARNPKVLEGNGSLEVGPLVQPIEIPTGTVSRAQGDVHPEGNPHVTLDPKRAGTIAEKIAERLGKLDAAHKKDFETRAVKFKSRLSEKQTTWKARIAKTDIKDVVTYHRALNYFLDAFEIRNPIVLEPKPGIPPTSNHILEVIRVVKEKKIRLIMVENFFDQTVADRIKKDVPGLRVVSAPAAVEGETGINSMDDLYEKLVKIVEGK